MSKKTDAWLSLNALLGVYGVKTSLLMTEDDYWTCATALWPHIKRTPEKTLKTLQRDIKLGQTKAARRNKAKQNIANVPARLLSEAPKHQKALATSLMGEAQ